jgi:hypothetical protein
MPKRCTSQFGSFTFTWKYINIFLPFKYEKLNTKFSKTSEYSDREINYLHGAYSHFLC